MEEGKIVGGRFQLVRELGQGGGGSVYLALNLHTETFWAVKKISSSKAPDQRGHELTVMKSLCSPYLPQIVDAFEDEGLWLVMEYIRGIPYDHYLQGGRTLPEKQVLETGLQVCEALCYLQAHDPPVFHLDIKPENLIRTGSGRVKLVDFGAAWRRDTAAVNEGTDGYAAPEQYRKEAVKDGRTDLYGLGATLYRLASGKRYSKVIGGGQVPGCGAAFSRVILKCLEEEPDRRFRSAMEVRKALLAVRRRYGRDRAKSQILLACALALPAVALCASVLPASMRLTGEKEWDYESLVKEAEVLPQDQAEEAYRKAVFLNPSGREAYLAYVEDAGRDGTFSDREETFLRDLLHTVPIGDKRTYEELLEEDSAAYGQVADRIGILYRYQYEGEEGRRISSGWFSKAEQAGEALGYRSQRGSMREEPGWFRDAGYHLVVSALEETAQGKDPDPDRLLRFWTLLRQGEDLLDEEARPVLRLERLEDMAWMLAFRAGDLCEAGLDPADVRTQAEDLDGRAEVILQKLDAEEKQAGEKVRAEIKDAVRTVLSRLGRWDEGKGQEEAEEAEDRREG